MSPHDRIIPNEPDQPAPHTATIGGQTIRAPKPTNPTRRGVPHDHHTETAILGALLLTDTNHHHIPELTPADFYSPRHSGIYAAISHLWHTGTPIDTVTVADQLAIQGDTTTTAGDLVALMADAGAAPTNFPHHIAILQRHTHSRRILHLTNALTTAAETGNLDAAATLLNDFEPVPATTANLTTTIRGRVLTGDDIEHIPEPTWLIDDYLVTDSLAMLYGRPGSYKSFVALAWSLHLATGTPFFGRPITPTNVLYCVAEGASGMKKRRRAWLDHHDLQGHPTERLYWLPMAIPLLDPPTIEAASTVASELHPGLIVIDTLSRSLVGADENSSRDMPIAVEAIEQLKAATGATVLVVHHSGKDADKGARGHTSLLGAIDTGIECKSGGDGIVTLHIHKQKDHPDGQVTRFRMTEVSSSVVLDAYNGSADTENALNIVRAVIDLDEGHGVTSGVIEDAVGELHGYSRSTYGRARKHAVDRQWLAQVDPDKRGSPYEATPAGKSAAAAPANPNHDKEF